MKNKLHLVSLGCTKNLVDSEVMLGRLRHYELTDESAEADVIIVNTCGFIDAAKEESIQTVLNLHHARKPDALLVMAGCLSERYKDELAKELPEVDLFTGVGDYDRIDELLTQKSSRFTPHVFLSDNHARVITGSSAHAYIKIAEGCNQSCAFCAIPSFKGKLRSRSVESIVKEVRGLIGRGYFDFSFISQDSSSFGRDRGFSDGLIELIRAVEVLPGIKSARLLYLYPSTTSLQLIETIARSSVFQNYFDMPIQHIDEQLLKRMKRGIGRRATEDLLRAMRAVDNSFVRTSVIVGFPGESDEAFEEVCRFIENFGFDRVNLFAYSDEEGTAAEKMEGKIDDETIDRRLERLSAIVEASTRNALQKMMGKTLEMLIEGPSGEHEFLLSARPLTWEREIDGEILINDSQIENLVYGKVYRVKITELAGLQLLGRVIDAV